MGTIAFCPLLSSVIGCAQRDEGGIDASEGDVLVVGATPAGIMAAIAAARLVCEVDLVEYHGHVGGMSTSGLGKSDIENKDAIAGLFKEFTNNVYQYYVDKYGAGSVNVAKCKKGYYYEPSVAEHIFNKMIEAETRIRVWLNHRIEKVGVYDDSVESVVFLNRLDGTHLVLKSKIVVDATYEGDVYALAGAAYSLGREGRDEFNEDHAGQLFFDYQEKVILEGSTGKGDDGLPAYTYRLCLTDEPENSFVLKDPPDGYDRGRYLGYFEDLKEGRLSGPKVIPEGHGYYAAHFDTLMRAFSFAEIPNGKYDVNVNPRPLAFPFPEENNDYVEADWEQRERVFKHHRNLVLGLLYFVQNDAEVPQSHRELARQYHLAKDEFVDNDHFPWQLYVREARRLKGKYVLTENDAKKMTDGKRNTVFADSVIAGEFPIDSFPVGKQPSPDRKVLEGYIGLLPISPYQIPYRMLIPEKIKGLIVPVAASTTHVAYSTVRMEPLWMGLGQVAGTAANLAIQRGCDIGDIPIAVLQNDLLSYNQILTYFDDVKIDDRAFKAIQFWGTKGFFDSYSAGSNEPLIMSEFRNWEKIFFKQLVSVPLEEVSISYDEDSAVSIADFCDSSLGKAKELLSNNQLHDFKEILSSRQWLFHFKELSDPILKGEACMAYFEILSKVV